MKRFYILLLLLLIAIFIAFYVENVEASEIKNITAINKKGLYDSECYINNAHYRTVHNGKCLDYLSVVSDNGLILETLTGDKRLIDSIEIFGSQGNWSTSEHTEYQNLIMTIIYLRSIGKNSVADTLEKLINLTK